MSEAPATPTRALWQSEVLVSDVVGRLIEFWGFKRNMGRVWAILYLSPAPLTAQEIRDLLQLSAGAVSMTLGELSRWGVVRKVWIQGDRRDHFAAETQLWRMVSRVFRERELAEITAAIEAFDQAIASLEHHSARGAVEDRKRAALQIDRIRGLLQLATLGKRLLEGLLATAKVDAEALARFTLSGARER